MPRDTASTFEPQIVKKRQRRLTGVDEIVLSLTARGLTTGEISAHFEEVYGARVSKDTVSRITEKVTGEIDQGPRPTGRGRARWAMRWKPALNAFAIAFEGGIN